MMRCVICGRGETRESRATLMFGRGGLTMALKDVPAEVCGNCGEEYVNESMVAAALGKAEQAACEGVQVAVREYVPA